ncbi:cobalt ECF transporter T component CbiQ [Tessaracoccus caeni]|uniref:cobalt ECF transporter T component CbiQ n=1 Tax=Tessaracoccus caeni TaxID=3031239 RepID=UPI0023DA79EE|nr:cobalt ECF transporter T component CbiQ [Tessaracoccus caeni]MDF1488983.1 cobalt ECF transporter T component CbiQ [Tessaracoccus caeni]
MASHHTFIDDAAWDSPWRRRRVGEKAGLSVALVLTALLTPPWPGCVLVAALATFYILGPAKIRPGLLALVLVPPALFLLIGTIPVAVHIGGDGWGLGPFRVSRDGLLQAAGLWAHGVAGTVALLLLATTTPLVDLLTWLRTLRIPDVLLEIASLTYRLLFVLLGTALAVHDAQQARLGDAAPLRRRFQASAGTVGSIVIRSWQRASRLQEGLEGRGYEDALLTLTPARPRDWRFVGASALSVAAVWVVVWVMR